MFGRVGPRARIAFRAVAAGAAACAEVCGGLSEMNDVALAFGFDF